MTIESPVDSSRLLGLERRVEALEAEIANFVSTNSAGDRQRPAEISALDADLMTLGRRVADGRPNGSYFNVRFRMFEAALLNIRALGYALGRIEAGRALAKTAPPAAPSVGLRSKICTKQDLESDWASFWASELKIAPRYHRKPWEFFYVAQALFDAGKLADGCIGLGFGCGNEPLPSLFAKYGAHVLATDLSEGDPNAQSWAKSHQHVNSVNAVRKAYICADRSKLENISFQPADMNAIPAEFDGKFDFCWSACSLEHLGGIDAGLRFIKNSLRTLKPGGVAVHTTEFSFDQEASPERWPTVIYREQHLVALAKELTEQGYSVAELDLTGGDDPLERFADLQIKELYGKEMTAELHLKTVFDGFVCTSVGLIVRVPEAGQPRGAGA